MSARIIGGNATIFVSDMDASLHFYTTVLGGELGFRGGPDWAEILFAQLTIGLHGSPKPENPCQPGVAGAICVGLSCDGPLEELEASMAAHGVSFEGPISDPKNQPVRIARLRDPDGNELYICQHKPLGS